jgi:nitroreductase
MDTFDAIYARRSVKHYDANHKMTQAEEGKLMDLAMQTPSSFNIQHWRLVKISEPALRQNIRAAAWDQAQITDASLVYVICADLKAWDKNPQFYWRNAPQPVQDFLVPMIKPFYEGKEQLQRDEAMRSVGFIGQTLMLSAKAMGYDSCPMIGFDSDKVAELINLPADHAIGMILVIGKATQPANPKGGFIEKSTLLIDNQL